MDSSAVVFAWLGPDPGLATHLQGLFVQIISLFIKIDDSKVGGDIRDGGTQVQNFNDRHLSFFEVG